jgi:hypothetical protein
MTEQKIMLRVVLDGDKAQASLNQLEGTSKNLVNKIVDFGVKGGVAFYAVKSAVTGLYNGIKGLLDAHLEQEKANRLVTLAFKEQTAEMQKYASAIQKVTNYGDEQTLPLMAKLATTYKLSSEEIKQLTPLLLDFADANSSTGMTISSAFDLMGRAVNGNTSMLSRYGIELDKTRLAQEGVSYLVEKLAQDYKGTATALADVRLQSANAIGDLKEEMGRLLSNVMNPFIRKTLEATYGLNDFFAQMGKSNNLGKANQEIAEQSIRFETLTSRLRVLGDVTNSTDADKELFRNTLVELKDTFGGYIGEVDTTITKYQDLVEAVDSAREAMIREAGAKMALAENQDLIKQIAKDKVSMQESYDNIADYQGKLKEWKESYNDALDNDLGDAVLSKYEVYISEYEALITDNEEKIEKLKDNIKSSHKKIDDIQKFYASAFEANTNLIVNSQGSLTEKLQAIDELYSKGKIEKLELELQQARESYESIAESEVEAKLEAYTKIKEIEKELDTEKENQKKQEESRLSERQALEEKYLLLSIEDEKERAIKELEILRDKELAKAEELKLGAEKRKEIEEYYAKEIEKVKTAEAEPETDQTSKQEKVFQDKLARLKIEKELGLATYDELKQALSDYAEFAKATYGDQSNEYLNALNDMRMANMSWGSNLRQIWKEAFDNFYQEGFEEGDYGLVKREEAYVNYLNRLISKEKEGSATKKALETEVFQHQEDLEKAKTELVKNGVASTLEMGSKLMTAYQGQSKSMFSMGKGLAIANAGMNTFEGVTKAIASYPPPISIIMAGIQSALGLAEIDKIRKTKFTPKAKYGGLTGLLKGPSHDNGGILIEAEGKEYITQGKRVEELGVGFFDFLNYAPLDSIKQAFSNVDVPSIPSPPPATKFAYASGGQVGSSSSIMGELIAEVKLLRAEFKEKNMTVNNYISANDVIEQADSAKFNEKNEEGSFVRSRW